MLTHNSIRYIDRHRAKMRLLRRRELEKTKDERNIKTIKIVLKKDG
jgi:dynactin complex subunit